MKYRLFLHISLVVFSFIVISPGYSSVVENWVEKGDTLYDQGKYTEAIDAYNKAIEITANNTTAWVGKGMALDALGKYDAAVAAYNEILNYQPNDINIQGLRDKAALLAGSGQATQKYSDPNIGMCGNAYYDNRYQYCTVIY
jgi:tetratricopeptide (TPR) repeat protein